MLKSLPTKATAVQVLSQLLTKHDLAAIKNDKQVVLMVGMPGSGKSTISEMLVAAYGYWRFSSDQIRTEELFPDQEHRKLSDQEKVMAGRVLVYKELARKVASAVKKGQRVVVDSSNLDSNRDNLMKALLEVASPEKIAFVIVQTPKEVMENRFLKEGSESAEQWRGLLAFWQDYLDTGRARYPRKGDYPGVELMKVKRYDLETFDWILQIGAIVWDVDGTLYQNQPAIHEHIQGGVIRAIAEHRKLSLTDAKKLLDETYQQTGSTTIALDELGLDGQRTMKSIFKTTPYETILQPDPKLLKLIKKLNHFHHVILTNADRPSTDRKLAALGLSPKLFSAIYTTYDMPYVKPHGRVFEYLISQTNLTPQQHLFVGDRVETDILPAKAVGMRTALVWKHHIEPDVSFDTVHQVGRLFGVVM